MSSSLVLRPFEASDAQAFRELNEAWIAKYFAIEEPDRVVLGNPRAAILEQGGQIVMAVLDGQAVGCCALLAEGPGEYELGKMCVAEGLRGQGIGRKLLEHVVALARGLGARRLTLGSSTKLPDAVHLYESVGFRHLPPERVTPSPYARADVHMEMILS